MTYTEISQDTTGDIIYSHQAANMYFFCKV